VELVETRTEKAQRERPHDPEQRSSRASLRSNPVSCAMVCRACRRAAQAAGVLAFASVLVVTHSVANRYFEPPVRLSQKVSPRLMSCHVIIEGCSLVTTLQSAKGSTLSG
jgi:hypothetical protein